MSDTSKRCFGCYSPGHAAACYVAAWAALRRANEKERLAKLLEQIAIERDMDNAIDYDDPRRLCAECGEEVDDEAVKCRADCGAWLCSGCKSRMHDGFCVNCLDERGL